MPGDEVITAYSVAVPNKQQQSLPGLDKDMNPGLEYSKQEVWDDEGKPHLVEYVGAGKLKGKTAIVTGGDSGIGRSAAILFAKEGARGITITYLPQEKEDAESAKKQVEESGAKVLLVETQLEEEADCKKVVDEHTKAFGTLNILVNNASKQIIEKDLSKIDLENVRSTFQSNILQMIAVTKFALPHMVAGASIINTTSVTAYKGSAQLIDYSSTKGAIVTFTRSLALQLAPKGIRVNAVAPGTVITALQAGSRDAENMEGLGVGQTPLHNRAAQPAEMGPSYVFLASSDSNAMTGQVLHVNMGAHVGAA
ncbi:NAD(P)-binding protein [Punctularia strigosozonata HHB-11173 SS5]|uniref:NAD(P)-binding protein n=1 Tax=Punctularia strigosozonata (strain HHB-11173) TaxID=741275 RepID=UPI000441691D|nr:NAD(P)-binding protein [Punctularia strigosozonata HHB-11173 SS5]EIN06817.1 NAD(P)-binding protein [Punctularia strigosozonata HHB-11173 SS5]